MMRFGSIRKKVALTSAFLLLGGIGFQSFVPGVVSAQSGGCTSCLSPSSFSSLGALSVSSGTITVDTTALTMTGAATFTGVDSGGFAVFAFSSISLGSDVTVNVTGSRPFVLVSQGTATIDGVIDANGGNAVDPPNFEGGPGAPGGPGGGAGGEGNIESDGGGSRGQGAGGGQGTVDSDTDNNSGAGAGGFGGAGARGGVEGSTPQRNGGAAYGDLRVLLEGGSGGGGASLAIGGGGGGGVGVFAAGTISMGATGRVNANGGNGNVGNLAASAGGSGGGILMCAPTITLVSGSQINARGGAGGAGGCCSDGGGGGGGRVALVTPTLTNNGTINVSGGASGTSGTGFTSGSPSPDPTGANGVVFTGVCTTTVQNVDSQVSFTITTQGVTGITGGCATLGYTNQYNINADLRNIGTNTLTSPFFQLLELNQAGGPVPTNPFRLRTADDFNAAACSGGLTGTTQAIPGPVTPNQIVPVNFQIAMPSLRRFRFLVSVFATVSGSATRNGKAVKLGNLAVEATGFDKKGNPILAATFIPEKGAPTTLKVAGVNVSTR